MVYLIVFKNNCSSFDKKKVLSVVALLLCGTKNIKNNSVVYLLKACLNKDLWCLFPIKKEKGKTYVI